MSQIEVFIVAAARIAIGSFGGALKDVPFADGVASCRCKHADLKQLPAKV